MTPRRGNTPPVRRRNGLVPVTPGAAGGAPGHPVRPADPETNVRQYLPRLERERKASHRFKPGFLDQMRAFLAGAEGPTLDEALALTELAEGLQAGSRD